MLFSCYSATQPADILKEVGIDFKPFGRLSGIGLKTLGHQPLGRAVKELGLSGSGALKGEAALRRTLNSETISRSPGLWPERMQAWPQELRAVDLDLSTTSRRRPRYPGFISSLLSDDCLPWSSLFLCSGSLSQKYSRVKSQATFCAFGW